MDKMPVYLIAGGRAFRDRKGPDPVIREVFKRSCVPAPVVAYLGAASGDNEEFYNRMSSVLTAHGAREVVMAPLCADNADVKTFQKILSTADVIFVSGGDVEAGMKVVQARKMVDFLKELAEKGKLFFGVSAGSIMLAKEWVRWSDPDDDSTAELFPCLGIASVLCDTHSEEDDWPELKAALQLEPPNTTGYGIVSGAAIIVHPDGRITAGGVPVHRFVRRSDGVERVADLLPLKV